MISVNAVIAQWIGKREHQEDSYLVRHYPVGTLAVVCDGMGGHMHGDVASKTAVNAFVEAFEVETETSIQERLQNALEAANEEVGRTFRASGDFGGTTLVAAFVGHGVLWWISVGDSPLYLWRRERLLRLNEDQSMRSVYMQYVQAGCLTFEDAVLRGHSLRSAVTGHAMELVDASATPYPLLPGDRIILTSDGTDDLLYVAALPPHVKAIFEDRTGNLSTRLVQACCDLNEPHADNVTVISMDWDN